MSSERGPGWELHLGDCIAGMREMADLSVDVVITDPPYDEATHTNHRVGNTSRHGKISASTNRSKDLGFDHLDPDAVPLLAEHMGRVARRWILTFCTVEQSGLWASAFVAAGVQYIRTCAWVKTGSTPQFSGDRPAVGFEAIVVAHRKGRKRWNGGGSHGLWTHPIVKPQTGARLHTTPKPLPLMRELVDLFSEPDELILDPFAGSGSTGIAALALGRRFVGFELSPEYHAIACRRLRGDEAKPRPEQPSLFDAIGAAR